MKTNEIFFSVAEQLIQDHFPNVERSNVELFTSELLHVFEKLHASTNDLSNDWLTYISDRGSQVDDTPSYNDAPVVAKVKVPTIPSFALRH